MQQCTDSSLLGGLEANLNSLQVVCHLQSARCTKHNKWKACISLVTTCILKRSKTICELTHKLFEALQARHVGHVLQNFSSNHQHICLSTSIRMFYTQVQRFQFTEAQLLKLLCQDKHNFSAICNMVYEIAHTKTEEDRPELKFPLLCYSEGADRLLRSPKSWFLKWL